MMRVGEVIRNLQDLMDKHGDIPVEDEYGKSFGDFEFNNDGGVPVIVFDLTNADNE